MIATSRVPPQTGSVVLQVHYKGEEEGNCVNVNVAELCLVNRTPELGEEGYFLRLAS